MRLLNTTTFEVEVFATPEETHYAILSHTWGEGEVTFADIHQPPKESRGWNKIRRSSEIAFNMGYTYMWIDTCCIDKASSAELSEAINSMYQWYEKAGVCIAFLEDLGTTNDPSLSDISQCRWFSRGWTLQELIAPLELLFYSKDWKLVGTRTSLKSIIAKVSGIPEKTLERNTHSQRERLDECPVAEKMSWVANRTTTRPEDLAYCLLGIFGINMPLLYGEGQVRAFKRLQGEILRSTDDDSIYAWSYPEEKSKNQHFWGLLADHPSAFARHGDGPAIKRARFLTRLSNTEATVTNRGLTVELALAPLPGDKSGTVFIALLDCDMQQDGSSNALTPGIILQRTSWHNNSEFVRIRPNYLLMTLMNRIIVAEDSGGGELDPFLEHVRLPEARPRQVFVPHKLSTPRSPRGILFHPEVAIKLLPQGTRFGLPVNVLSQPSNWLFYDEMLIDKHTARGLTADQAEHNDSPEYHLRTKSYVLVFDQSSGLGVTEPTQPIILGSLELEINRSSGRYHGHVYLVTGLEPLSPNPLGTPSLYTVPWYAFVSKDKVVDGGLDDVLLSTNRVKHKQLSERVLSVHFELEARHSRLFYKVVLKAVGIGEKVDEDDEDGA